MREMGNWREYQISRFANDPEEAINYLQLTLEEYLADGDLPFFLKELRVFIASQGGFSELSKRNRKKPTNRNYICTSCGFTSHRDGVGAINIRQKYRGLLGQHVVAEKVSDRMAPPVYLRISEVPVASS